MHDELAVLADSSLSRRELIGLRQIAESLKAGLLTADEAQNAANHVSPKFEGIFDPTTYQSNTQRTPSIIIEVVELVLKTRITS
jgi:hypothetical protein